MKSKGRVATSEKSDCRANKHDCLRNLKVEEDLILNATLLNVFCTVCGVKIGVLTVPRND